MPYNAIRKECWGGFESPRPDKYYILTESKRCVRNDGIVLIYHGHNKSGQCYSWDSVDDRGLAQGCMMLKAGYPGTGVFGIAGVGRMEYIPEQECYFYEVEKEYAHSQEQTELQA